MLQKFIFLIDKLDNIRYKESMDLQILTFLVQAFMALVGGFSFAVDLILKPLKKDVERLEVEQAKREGAREA